MLANLHRIYTQMMVNDRDGNGEEEDDSHPVKTIIDSVEKRWAKVDQDLFISCFFLNPFISRSLLNASKVPLAYILGILRRLYLRVFDVTELPSKFMALAMQYAN